MEDYLDDPREPYIFVRKPLDAESILENLSFEGIRLYTRGKDILCYRPQNKENVEPFGNTYQLDIKGMFKDMLQETHKKDKIGHEVIKYIIEEIKTFFVRSAEAEKEQEPTAKDSGMGSVGVVGGAGNDYSNMVTDPRNSRV